MIESKGHKITPIDGDLAVSRNAEIGGDADIHGKARVAGSLKVEGFLDAPNIKGAAKGLFNSVEELTREYPNPRPGWFAIVLDATNKEKGILYKAENRGWVATTDEAKPYEFIMDSINVFASKGELAEETQRAQSAENKLQLNIEEEAATRMAAVGEIKGKAALFGTFASRADAEGVSIKYENINHNEGAFPIPVATEEKAGIVSAADRKHFVKSFTWNNDNDPSNMNDFVVAGVYDIKGEHTRVDDNLPIINTGGGHSFNARLTVLDSSITGSGKEDDKCITQVLSFSNRLGQGEVYIRTGKGRTLDSLSWEQWSTLQRNVNVVQIRSLDNLIDNGIYSGVLTPTGETFVLVVINNYAFASQHGTQKCISQFKYSVDPFGAISFGKRVKIGNADFPAEWDILNRNEIDKMLEDAVAQAIANVVNGAPEAFDTLKDIADWIEKHGDVTAIYNAIQQNTAKINASIKSLDVSPNTDDVELGLEDNTDKTTHVVFPAATTEKAGVMSANDKKALDSLPIRLGDVNAIELEQSQFSNLIWDGTKFVPANNSYNSYILRIPEQTPLTISSPSIKNWSWYVFKECPYEGYSTQDFIRISNQSNYPEGIPSGYGYLVIQIYLKDTSNYDAVVTFSEHGLGKRISTLSKKIDEIVPTINEVAAYATEATFSRGFIIPQNGNLSIFDDSAYVHALMDCVEGQRFTISSARGTSLAHVWQFLDDSNNVLIKYEGGAEPVIETEIVAPLRAKKILVNSEVSWNPSIKFWSSNTPENALSKEIKEVKETVGAFNSRVEELEDNYSKPLQGKTILCLGDSITEFTGVDGKKYSDHIIEKTGATVINCGIGGTKIARRKDLIPLDTEGISNDDKRRYAYAALDISSLAVAIRKNDFSLQESACAWLAEDGDDNTAIVDTLKQTDINSVDIIVLFAGANDVGEDHGTIGSIGPDDKRTNIAQGFECIIRNLLLANPNLRIYYFTPIPRYFGDLRNFNPEEATNDVNWCDNYHTSWSEVTYKEDVGFMIELAQHYKVPNCNMYNSIGINQFNIKSIMGENSSDGVHPVRGFKMIANRIVSFIEANNNLNI